MALLTRAFPRRRAAPAPAVRHQPGEAVSIQWGMDMRPIGCGVLVATSREQAEQHEATTTDLSNKPVKIVVYRKLDAQGNPVTGWISHAANP